MAITVIKAGVDPAYEYASICPTCGSLLRYKYEDCIKEAPISAWHEFHLVCPTCGHYFGRNPNPIKKKKLTCTGTLLYQSEYPILIPNGAKAYGLYVNGPTLEAHQFDTAVPEKTPCLFIGTFEEIELLNGVTIPNSTTLKKADLVELDIDSNRTECYFIENDFSLVKVPADVEITEKFGLHPLSVGKNTSVINFDL